jgi:hypothetical protein
MNKELPIYEVVLDEGGEANFVAFVSHPAIQKNFLAFSEAKPLQFSITSEDRRIVSGPLMLADLPIYRKIDGQDCYVTFSKETIEKMAIKFFKHNYQGNVNLMHDRSLIQSGVIMFESWIVDRSRGILPMQGFDDAPDGSWFGSYKVENDETWQRVKDGEVSGFSLEVTKADLQIKMTEEKPLTDEEVLEKIKDLLRA